MPAQARDRGPAHLRIAVAGSKAEERNRALCSERVERRRHAGEGRDGGEAELVFEDGVDVLDVVGEVGGLVRVGADGDDPAAAVFVEAQDVVARQGVRAGRAGRSCARAARSWRS